MPDTRAMYPVEHPAGAPHGAPLDRGIHTRLDYVAGVRVCRESGQCMVGVLSGRACPLSRSSIIESTAQARVFSIQPAGGHSCMWIRRPSTVFGCFSQMHVNSGRELQKRDERSLSDPTHAQVRHPRATRRYVALCSPRGQPITGTSSSKQPSPVDTISAGAGNRRACRASRLPAQDSNVLIK